MAVIAVCSTTGRTSLTEYTRRIETVLRTDLEAARLEFSKGGATQPAAERYRAALMRFNHFVIHREIPPEYKNL